ncbi:NAD(P)-binding domain-containing protein [Kribbella sp. NBC_00709]|uniref:NAD(P)-binding domain-containing protein n=1 Tax=Kribbella sp. NBC_00709 TaxID=2975972 RepID=UPI002E2D96A5|nr:NAD(P)-binding domain-containing protein [Kribbella sp. NBC_00709]
MRIGTLGNGLMAEALAGQWVKAGHDVMIGGRDPERAAEVAKRIGAVAGSLVEAASYGEVVLLAVPADDGVEVVAELVRDIGCVPVAAGGSVRAKLLEATAALAIGIWVGGGDVRGMFPPLAAAFGAVRPG